MEKRAVGRRGERRLVADPGLVQPVRRRGRSCAFDDFLQTTEPQDLDAPPHVNERGVGHERRLKGEQGFALALHGQQRLALAHERRNVGRRLRQDGVEPSQRLVVVMIGKGDVCGACFSRVQSRRSLERSAELAARAAEVAVLEKTPAAVDALGRRRTAEVKRDAEIGEAEAQRDSKMKASVAMQEGERVKFDAEAQIAQAQRDFQIKQAQYQAEVQAEQARATQAGPLAEASAKQNVIAEQIKIDRVRTQGQIAVQEQEVLRRQKELEATIIKPAQAEQQAQIVRAEAEKQRQAIEADGKRQALIALAEAEQQRLEREGLGRAKAIEAEGRAQAAKIEAMGLAEARAIEAKGLAEAAAILKKAEAWKQFNEAAKLQALLEKLPSVIASAAPVFSAIASPLGSIDKVVVIDQGNGSASSGITRFAQTSPSLVFNLLEQLKALNINLPELLGQLNGSEEAKKE